MTVPTPVAAVRARIDALVAHYQTPLMSPAPVTTPAGGAGEPGSFADVLAGLDGTPGGSTGIATTEATQGDTLGVAELGGPADAAPVEEGETGGWAARLPGAARPWVRAIRAAARKAGIDPRLVAAVAWAESAFRPNARSGAGAVGLMQLMPGTARGLGVDPTHPVENLEGGARYLARQLERFGKLDLALAAYNAGPTAVSRHGGVPPYSETRHYVNRVQEILTRLTDPTAEPTGPPQE